MSLLEELNSIKGNGVAHKVERWKTALQDRMRQESKLGRTRCCVNDLLATEDREFVFDAMAEICKEPGISQDSSYVGRAGSHEAYGDYYKHYLMWGK